MNRSILGNTGLQVSPLCFGTWQLSPRFWGELSKSEIFAAMHTAYDAGINFFDTADAYGDGYAETVLGEFLAEKQRDDIVVCTKVFNHFNPDGSRYPDLSSAHVRERCELELQRLSIETIDLYLLHFFDPLTSPFEIAATLESLKEQGKIRNYGVSNHTVEHLRALRCFGAFEVAQPAYSLLDRNIETDLLSYCQGEKIGVMVYSPLHKGLLSGKYQGTETFTDFRKHHADFQGERFKVIAQAVQKLVPLAEKYDFSIVQLVLSATLNHPGIDVAIVGIKNREQIAEATKAVDKSITREDYFAIRDLLTIDKPVKIADGQGKSK